MSLTTYLTKIFAPQGISKIIFSTTKPTQVIFSWEMNNEGATIILNQFEYESLSPELRYFVLMHEVGHIKKMTFPNLRASQEDENEADQFALIECGKVGIFFESTQQARELYRQAFLQTKQTKQTK